MIKDNLTTNASNEAESPAFLVGAVIGSALSLSDQFLYDLIKLKIENSDNGYYLSWWLRLDYNNNFTTAQLNYQLKKLVKKGLLMSKSNKYGIEYRLP
jgi:hypothetical protein